MNGYAVAEIDDGGFIWADAAPAYDGANPRKMVHRESIFPFRGQVCYGTISDAKEALPEPTRDDCIRIVIAVKNGAGCQGVHCFPKDREVVEQRLRIWAGCYGRWPLRRMNAVVSAV